VSRRKYGAGKFSKESYNKNDKWGIDRITEFLKRKGFTIHDKEEEDYKVDILAEKNGKLFHYEAEVKSGYPFTCVDDFKFPTVSFLGRKKKFHNNIEGGFYYCIVCKETEAILYCHSSKIYNEDYRQLKTINTKLRKGLDEFYLVPKEVCDFVEMKKEG
jgi:hypothetical protein